MEGSKGVSAALKTTRALGAVGSEQTTGAWGAQRITQGGRCERQIFRLIGGLNNAGPALVPPELKAHFELREAPPGAFVGGELVQLLDYEAATSILLGPSFLS
jgi:hypothetical protein